MRLSSLLARLSPVCLVGCFAAVLAQQPDPALEQILSRIEANTEQYKSTVPSFLCDEHITSQEIHDGQLKHETTVEALFRVARSPSPDGALEESREVKSINGKSSSGKKLDMPISFRGGFSGALAKFLSADRHECFDYQSDRSSPASPGTEAFTFTARESAAKQPACVSIQPGTTGKFVIDTASAQVTHIERTVPNPVGKDQAVRGTASVDFAPVTLNGRSFWLPTTVIAFTTETPKTNAFRFTAKYSNYHRFAASSTILPTTSDTAQPQPR
ncbi:hypothetical protein RBB79_19985 [Tunturiibacter empetritectus]|uniref:Uncharacterized protein n=1 Tax=Tunturiibacter lichenicola TaxID=2051959 RepID=A0A852VGJ1_9BACT|nr:hypothetical protein [Edaphobacter lichenicola]NYF91958.1 hypothetical protein [Edaphobacter lichenicola]